MKYSFTAIIVCLCLFAHAQTLAPLSVEKIMRDQKWIGSSPSNIYWSADGKQLFFSWNPENATADSVYYITTANRKPVKASPVLQQETPSYNSITYNSNKTAYTYTKYGDIFYVNEKGNQQRITQTVETETSPVFIKNNSEIVYLKNQNLYAWHLASGLTTQLTNFVKGNAPKEPVLNVQEKWLQQDAIRMSAVLQERKKKKEETESWQKQTRPKPLRPVYTEDKNVFGQVVSPDGRFISFQLSRPATNIKSSIIPNYVTESGFTTDINGRQKVGVQSPAEFFIFDTRKDTVLPLKTQAIPGLTDLHAFTIDYPKKDTAQKVVAKRALRFRGPVWNEQGTKAVIDIRSADNKDRWLMLLEPASATLKLIDRQTDEAWIAGPGIGSMPVWADEQNIIFQSEKKGYSHIYKIQVDNGNQIELTSGPFEVNNLQLSKDKKTLYFTSNETHPGDYQFYRMPVNGGARVKLTNKPGMHTVSLSPDEKTLAFLYSYSNQPWELFLQDNKPGATANRITNLSQSAAFSSYKWRDPEIVTFAARDGAQVYARLYKPSTPHPSKPAVIFVHGAGYLQNVHKGWSSYSREYMFHNLLADEGYTVLDIDYRGSAGYGRDWRTGIYRYMGGKDLTDHVDGAAYLVQQHGVDAKKVGIYGGSYGGFITLMAMFTQQEVFAAGAALRSVTDWAHYNHGYTSNILNEPFTDSLAYAKSSPIYYAEGLKGHLLMCHGMVDVNVHFQDIVRLTQRLIELKKDNWELAVYPVEDHAFTEPSSWTDEYKRILKLFDNILKK